MGLFSEGSPAHGGQVFPCLASLTVAGRMEPRYIYFILVHQNKVSAAVLEKQKTRAAGSSSWWEPEKRTARCETDGGGLRGFVSSWVPTKWCPGQTSAGSRLAERGTKPQIGAIAVHHEEIANLLYCCPHPNFSLSLRWSWRARRYFSYNLPFLFLLAQFSVSCWHRLAWLSSTTAP